MASRCSKVSRSPVAGLPALLLLLAATQQLVASQVAASEMVTITMKPAASVNNRVVLIGDVAEVSSRDPSAADRIARIDISDPPQRGKPVRLPRSQVEIRLMLAGVARHEFQITGADDTEIRYQTVPINDSVVIQAVRSAVAERLRIAPDDVQLVLLHPLRLRGDYHSVMPDDLRLDVRLPASVQTQAIRTNVGLHVRDRLREVTPVSFDLKLYAVVPTILRQVHTGESFSESNVIYRRTLLDAETLSRAAADLAGKRAGRPLTAGQVVQQQHLMSPSQLAREVLVRPRDRVAVVVQRGALHVRMKDAVALELGRRGDFIRVRNPSSNKVIQGRVSGDRTVEIPF